MGIFPPPHLLTRPEVSAHKQSLQSTFSAMHWASLGLLSSLVLVITLAKLKRHPVLLSVSSKPSFARTQAKRDVNRSFGSQMFAAFVTNDIFNLLTYVRELALRSARMLSLTVHLSSLRPIRFRHPVHPSWSLCLVSQAGTTAGTALGTTSVMSMVLVIWSLLRDRAGKKVMDRGFVPLLVCLPWAIFILIFALSIIVSPSLSACSAGRRGEGEGGLAWAGARSMGSDCGASELTPSFRNTLPCHRQRA